jgi:plasmid stability protein
MSAVTLRDLPPDLHEFLKADAAADHRSFNKQVIVALDAYRQQRVAQAPRRLTPEEKRAHVREIQQEIRRVAIHTDMTDDELLEYDENSLFK